MQQSNYTKFSRIYDSLSLSLCVDLAVFTLRAEPTDFGAVIGLMEFDIRSCTVGVEVFFCSDFLWRNKDHHNIVSFASNSSLSIPTTNRSKSCIVAIDRLDKYS